MLQGITRDYRGLQRVTRGYKGFKRVTGFPLVTECYN